MADDVDPKVLAAARGAFPGAGTAGFTPLGAVVHEGHCHPEPIVGIPLPMMNRHGLIAGATGTGKTKTLQLLAQELSAQGVPGFVTDIKGDVSGMAAAGTASERVSQRSTEVGDDWADAACPVEFLTLG